MLWHLAVPVGRRPYRKLPTEAQWLHAGYRLSLAAAKLEKEQALAKLRALQTAALEGRLLDRDQVLGHWSQAFAALRDRALGMADRIASRGAGRNTEELRTIVNTEVRDLLGAVSRGES